MPLPLATLPTPLTRLGPLTVKRDDQSAATYGGNKVRKLAYLLEDARAKGATRVVTLGAAGSHHVLATTHFAGRLGLPVTAILVPQPRTPHAIATLRATLAQGATIVPARSWLGVPLALARGGLLARGAYLIPAGGSNARGSLGYVDAAAEVRGEDPAEIVTALGSGGTVAGLAVGAVVHGLRAQIRGVVVADPAWALPTLTARLIAATARLVDRKSRVLATAARARLVTTAGELGRGYGYPTARGEDAAALASPAGLLLDGTYTAKAFADAYDRAAARPGEVLYWHTLSSAPLAPLQVGGPAEDALLARYGALLPVVPGPT